MGREAWSVGVIALIGFVSAAVAGTYQQDGFSFLTSETNNYSPLRNYYAVQQQQQQQPSYSRGSASVAPSSPDTVRPVVRKNRGVYEETYIATSPIYLNKAALYYPESAVFSEPLPIVPLPQLPNEFLTLKTAQVTNTGTYGGSENEVPKKSSKKKGRRGKSGKTTTPAPEEEEEEEEDDAQETEGDDGDSVSGGYESLKPMQRQRQQSRSRSRQREEGLTSSGEGATGGYPSSFDSGSRSRSRSEGLSSSGEGATGGYPSNFDSGSRSRSRSEGISSSGEGATGGYPSSFDANADENTGVNDNRESQRASSKSRSRSKSQGRRERNRGDEDEEEDAPASRGEIEGDEEEDEIMMTGDDATDENEESTGRDATLELDTAAEEEEEEEIEEKPKRGRSKSGKRGGKKRGGRGKGRGGSDEENDDETSLNTALSNQGQKIETFYVPTFGNNVLNTVFPAYSQNALLRSLESQVGLGNQGYPESQQDVSAISIAADDDKKKSRKSKKRTSARKNRPASRARSSSSRRGKSRKSSVRAQEPNDQNQDRNRSPSQQQSQRDQGQTPEYGPPQFTPGNPSSEYGAPSSFQQSQGGGISPPPQSNQGGYRTINNELRGRTSDLPPQFQRQQQSINQDYCAPSSSCANGGGSPQSTFNIEPRQISQATVVASGNNQFSSVADSNNPVTAELIRTVQAILQKYPN